MREEIEKLRALWLRERDAERERFRAERASTSVAQRVERGQALASLDVLDTSASSGDRTVLWVEPEGPIANFRASTGAPVLLWWDAPTPETSISAVIGRRRGRRMSLVVDEYPPERILTGTFNLDLEAPETTFKRGDRALATIAQLKPSSESGRLVRALFGELEVEETREEVREFFDPALNDAQKVAVTRALRSEPIALIHGPPGTGKTRTLVEVVRQAVSRDQRVLITAASNAAVDNLAERLIEAGVDVVRLGHPARVSESVEAHSLDARLEARADFALAKGWMDEANTIRRRIHVRSDRGNVSRTERRDLFRQARELMNDARNHLRGIERAIVASASVVAATAAGSDAAVLREEVFDLVVLDEATQAPDPIAAVAILRAPRLVLAGDPHQLPPTIIDPDVARAGLGTTFFERRSRDASLLRIQHRMHRKIMAFPSASKYEDKLVAAEDVAGHTLEELGALPDPLRDGPFVFVDTAGKGWDDATSDDDPSTRNPGHADRTAAEVRRLLSRGVAPSDIAVITPYFAQARLLRERVTVEGLEIDTIDAFQGREKEAVVVDLVRSNAAGELGFLKDTRRMNVALTRARRFLLVVGDSSTLGGNTYYDAFLAAVESHGTWVSAWNDDAEPLDAQSRARRTLSSTDRPVAKSPS